MTRASVCVLTCSLLPGCSDPTVNCAPSNHLAIGVRPEDALSAAPLAATTTGLVQAGSYQDSLRSHLAGPDTLAAGRRAGTYAAHLTVPGYLPFDTAGLAVALVGSPCQTLNTLRFTARLTASP